MRKFFLAAVVVSALVSCGGSDTKTSTETSKTEPAKEEAKPADLSSNPDYQKGLKLIANSDCLTCHSVSDKINGPAYKDIANKYASLPDTIIGHLANKIISGGGGVWGEVPMTPHASLSKEDAEAMVKYVLLLKQ